ncbi:MAG: dihydroorotase [Gammaproteobacteria bacterium]|jgi:dihydroorotase|tara:strand:- start:1671 stop:3011 length:1341 start_codon:yes stop_codon:yes gene_type:complete
MAKKIHYDIILKNGKAVLPDGTMEVDIAIKGENISAIGNLSDCSADNIIDCTGLHILPGVIDSQVHFREPGLENKENLESGMLAAAAGGVVAVFEMPNTSPLTITPETIEDKLSRASRVAWTDYAFYLGGTGRTGPNLGKWENAPGICGIKIFMGASTGDLLAASDDEVTSVLSNGKRVVAVHAEDQYIMEENMKTILGDSHDVSLHCKWRSPESCLSATKRVVNIARKYNRRVHVLHITTSEEMDFLRKNKDIASVELLANHLTLHAPDCYENLGTLAQQNPPIREKHHQDALWKALNDGTVDILASDHAPHTLEEKAEIYPKSPSGTPGVQTLVPVMLNHVNEGRLTLEKLVELWSYGPERIHGLVNKGRIKEGYNADFTIVDLNKKNTITNAQQKSKTGWTPYDGMKVKGWPIMTIIRGHMVMREDEMLEPIGKPVLFKETIN